ncbi:MAG: hypothetical protein DRP37_03260 [Thermodesulfobacteriota bacterium]|nr:MAG: hypothetical protein DRP37_03260 [Thermodesulfobacteriota bacterium]
MTDEQHRSRIKKQSRWVSYLLPIPLAQFLDIKGIAQPDELLTSSEEDREPGGNQRIKGGKRGMLRRLENGSGKM